MHVSLLEVLRCPFCGTRPNLIDNPALVRTGDRIDWGVLGCECCAYPVIDGVPVLIADDATRDAMHAMEAGRREEALHALLGLDSARAEAFEALRSGPGGGTFGEAMQVLSPDPEGTYFLYRFSDPTFVLAESLLRAVAQHSPVMAGRALDLCGGSGHLTRVIGQLGPAGGTVLADVFFWKLWLAKTFTAPDCTPVCCDANNPLPFARASFSLVVLSDAFPYIWHKRMLADEMLRAAGPNGTVVMPHLHSSRGWNYSQGMTLNPESYAALFAPLAPRLYSDATLLEAAIAGAAVPLDTPITPEALGDQPSCSLVAGRDARLFQPRVPVAPTAVTGELRVNPLYRVTHHDGRSTLTLTFPNGEYEDEFGDCKRYLPATLDLPGDLRGAVAGDHAGIDVRSLRRARVLIDAPPRYC